MSTGSSMENKPKLMDLRPDRALLNPEFDGYKLSLIPIPTITEDLEVSVDRLVPTVNQYSLLHAKLFMMQNHLVGECDNRESVYFVDNSWHLHKYHIAENANQFASDILWQIPKRRERGPGDYNITFKLPTETLAVVSDGMGFIYIVDRGSRSTNDPWRMIFSSEVVPDQNFVIAEARHHDNKLHLLLISIIEEESKHVTVINWVTLQQDKTSWNETVLRELVVKGYIQYLCLETNCEALYVVTETGCKFTLDSDNTIDNDEALTNDTAAVSNEEITIEGEAQPLPDLSHLDALTSENEEAPSTGTTFNSQQVEECDFESDKLSIFERIDANTHKTTHKVNLGSHRILLTVSLDKRAPLAFGVRSDVDCCIFQPSEDCSMIHKGTLLAMAYIQASKQQMKYFICSPNMAFSVICEASKHVFIYRQNKSIISTELRNRVTGQRISTLAQQQVLNLAKNEQILGVYASNFYLYILGETFITALKL